MIPGYVPNEVMFESPTVLVQRCRRHADGALCIVKMAKIPGDTRTFALLRHEHSVLSHLGAAHVPYVAKALQLYDQGDTVALVLKVAPGQRLRDCQGLSWQDVLRYARDLAVGLDAMHAAGVLYLGMGPHQVMVYGVTGQVELVNFQHAVWGSRVSMGGEALDTLGDVLPFAAPELTGRSGRSADARADLYGLGATLYTLLAGRAPFVQTQPRSLAQAIVHDEPLPLRNFVPDLPGAIAQVVHTLLAKAPEDRYQAASELAEVLNACLEHGGAEASAPAPRRQFELADGCYGREAQTAALVDAYERIAKGKREGVVLEGPPGSGKTRLLHSLAPAMLMHDGLLLTGKAMPRGAPWQPLTGALEMFVQRVLCMPTDEQQAWQQRLRKAMGPVGHAFTGVMPGLERLLGTLPPAARLPAAAHEQRLLTLLQRCVRAVCSVQPVVLFLDDMQWTDSATLRGLQAMFGDDPPPAGLLVVLGWDSETVGTHHPARQLCETLRAQGATWQTLPVKSLRADDVHSWLRASFGEMHGAAALVLAVMEQTQGNPQAVQVFLRHVQRLGHMQYDATARRWHVQVEALAGCGMPAAGSRTARPLEVLTPGKGELWARQCLTAARHAKEMLDYPRGVAHVEAALAGLPKDAWETHGTLLQALHLERAECWAMQPGSSHLAEKSLARLLERCKTVDERLLVQQRRVWGMLRVGNHDGALDLGEAALRWLGAGLTVHRATWTQAMASYARTEWALRKHHAGTLVQLPVCQDAKVLARAQLLMSLMPAAQALNPDAGALVLTLALVDLTLTHGVLPQSSAAFAQLTHARHLLRGYHPPAFREMARVARTWLQGMVETTPGAAQVGETTWALCMVLDSLEKGPEDAADAFMHAYQLSRDHGELHAAIWARTMGLFCLSHVSLDRAVAEAAKVGRALTYASRESMAIMAGCLDAWGSLSGSQQASPVVRSEPHFPASLETRRHVLCVQAMTYCILDDYDQAVTLYREAAELGALKESAQVLPFHFFGALALLRQAAARKQTKVSDPGLLKQLMGQLASLAEGYPTPYAGMATLLEAEMAALQGKDLRAVHLYEKAMTQLQAAGFVAHRAAALECVARFWQSRRQMVSMAVFIKQAADAYGAWGAQLKVRALAREFPALIATARQERPVGGERITGEIHIAGGFAHEMRNALGTAGFGLGALLGETDDVQIGAVSQDNRDHLHEMARLVSAVPDVSLQQAMQTQLQALRDTDVLMTQTLRDVHRSVERALTISQEIMQFAQVGAVVAGEEHAQLRNLVDKLLAEYQDRFERHAIRCTVSIPADLQVSMREQHAYIILRNLIDNACDAMRLNPAAEAERVLRIRAEGVESFVGVAVEDTGPGMPDEVQTRVFQPFFSTKGSGGTGLGLGMSKKLAELYGGRIQFSSRFGHGTTFKLSLPRR